MLKNYFYVYLRVKLECQIHFIIARLLKIINTVINYIIFYIYMCNQSFYNNPYRRLYIFNSQLFVAFFRSCYLLTSTFNNMIG